MENNNEKNDFMDIYNTHKIDIINEEELENEGVQSKNIPDDELNKEVDTNTKDTSNVIINNNVWEDDSSTNESVIPNIEPITEDNTNESVIPNIEPITESNTDINQNIDTPVESNNMDINQNIEPSNNIEEDKINTSLDNNIEYNNKKEKKGNGLLIFIILLLLIGIGIGGYFFYKKVSSPKNIYATSINYLFNKTLSVSDEVKNKMNFDYKKDTIETSGKLEMSFEGSKGDYEKLASIGKIGIGFDTILSIANKEISANLSYNEGDKKLISGDAFLKDKKIYLKSSDLFNKEYFLNIPDDYDIDKIFDESLDNISTENYILLLKKLNKFINNSLKDDYFTQENGTFTVDDNKITGLKTSFDINETKIINIENSIINSMLDDKEFIDLIVKIDATKSENEIREKLKDIIKENEDKNTKVKDVENPTKKVINIYSNYLGQFLALDYTIDNKDVITSVVKNKVNTIKINYNDDESSKITITIDDKNNITTMNIDKFNAKLSKIENGYNLTIDSSDLKVNCNLTNKSENQIENNNIDMNIKYDNANMIMNFSTETKKVDSIKTFDISGATDIEKISDEDIELISNKLNDIFKDSKIMTYLSNLMEDTTNNDKLLT